MHNEYGRTECVVKLIVTVVETTIYVQVGLRHIVQESI